MPADTLARSCVPIPDTDDQDQGYCHDRKESNHKTFSLLCNRFRIYKAKLKDLLPDWLRVEVQTVQCVVSHPHFHHQREKAIAKKEAEKWNQGKIEDSAPVAVIGSGANLNLAIDNGLQRTADLFDMTVPEVMNRVTITGAIEIGRAPGVVTISLRIPVEKLKQKGLWDLVRYQYHLYE